jgi:protein-S-isoprenylcysteine O-methyltransferase Ste14
VYPPPRAAAARLFAFVGVLLFGGSLALFAYHYLIAYARPVRGALRWQDVAFNVGLFTAFALHHSAFARTPLRQAVVRRAPEYERPLYVWIASLLFAVICVLWRPLPGVAWAAPGALRWLCAAMQLGGVLLTAHGARMLDVRELAGLHVRPTDVFTTAGAYGWIRHPLYAGWFLMVLPATPMTATRLTFALVSCAYLLIAIPLEEGTLRRTAGPAYADYVRRVRWRLLPGVY